MITYRKSTEYIPGLVEKIPQQKRKRGNQGRKKKVYYKDVICTFDIETSRLTKKVHPAFAGEIDRKTGQDDGSREHAILYLWAFHFHHHETFVGRTWQDLRGLLQQIESELKENEQIVVWVHNLSYEFQFLRAIFDPEKDEVFAVGKRKVLKFTTGKIEFRCSYLHSNMSLKQYTEKMGVEHKKLSGEEYDYNKLRFPWTPIEEKEMLYMLHDVIGLAEALEKEMQMDNDNLYTIPITSTGYVRRDAKAAMREVYKPWTEAQKPDLDIYIMLRAAFRGGNTHANRNYAGRILENVKSADRSSSYPDCQVNDVFPVSPFVKYGPMSATRLDYFMNTRKKAMLLHIAIKNIRLQDRFWPVPYISSDKCLRLEGAALDNGRVLSADYLETILTDIDFRIVTSEYCFDSLEIVDSAAARYGRLPEELLDVAREYYKRKTELKDVDGQEVYYTKSKNKLNSIAGMSEQDPGKRNVFFADGEWQEDEETPLADILDDGNRRSTLPYAWGVWITAWGRYRLEEGIRMAGRNLVYVDTDSVKYLGEIDWTEYNAERIRRSKTNNAYATDIHGVTHYMGVYEQEADYAEFATLGAKKYAFRYEKGGPTKITIAGVTKAKGGKELDRYGGLERFVKLDPPFVFREAGGVEAYYVDEHRGAVEIDGHSLELPPCVVLRDSTYTLGITEEYRELIYSGELPLDKWAGNW